MSAARQRSDIDTHIQGIPCGIVITHYRKQKPLGPRADSDLDCYGYTDAEYTVLDRHGYRAEWLESKLTPDDHTRICELIDDYKEDQRDEY